MGFSSRYSINWRNMEREDQIADGSLFGARAVRRIWPLMLVVAVPSVERLTVAHLGFRTTGHYQRPVSQR